MRDKTGREIKAGDILREFHFVHRVRHRHCYMYKLVVEINGKLHFVNIQDLGTVGLDGAHKGLLSWMATGAIEIIDSSDGPGDTDWYDREKKGQQP